MLQDVAMAACTGHALPWSVIPIPAPLSSLHAVAHSSGLCAPPFFICLGWCFSSQIMLSWLRSSHKSDLLALGLFSGLLPTP